VIPSHLNFKHLKSTVSIATLLTDKGLIERFKNKNNRLIGPCPVHGGDNPNAFVVDLSKNVWYCFTGCQKGGTVIDLACYLNNTSPYKTAIYLASLSGIAPSPNEMYISDPQKEFRPFIRKLPLNPDIPLLRHKGIKSHTANRFEVGAYNGNGFLADCIGVRLHDMEGRPLGYTGRRLNDRQIEQNGKWKLPRNFPKKETLYNFYRVRSQMKNGLVVVESPWSVMRFAQIKIPTVALMGVSIPAVLNPFLPEIPQLILILDGDNAGRMATVKIENSLKSKTIIHHVSLPKNLDPDDLKDEDLRAITNPFFL